ncbi:hypothetical protein HFU84_14010 [Acidithiobacillus sp. CV18-2]|uniref:DUF1641 domain-containing protein n=1 Tax=Igneacidithiobacillus copahuensis TaxID=2724909 RepID=A0AAE2YMI6_9PROT|nr:hypothetical protein [Igneacidithiobacillus copahuensis]MBU2753913.1 hypothetical protein [Acidithiobacillus sp. CV18-3]MBU2756106.1 hypothetical protein [Acidithiobacillus sp. BN09-2]MBU2778586.1 hypothetical protein [Acidithiobacillus sp. CV18-2]MBU2797153.1 hypothetical protein [Acidithiobacillus sp. VAN18-2]MBU2798958.1 hypothetical protein [Acidithiobacillus sp. VAN18-4]UTV81498.1 hypothetical protein MQE22_02450 [Acidithiobacillus sp. YTS05]
MVAVLDSSQEDELQQAQSALLHLVHNGDLERIVHLARLMGAAADSMSDEMVGRMAEIATGGLDLVDRVERADLTRALPAISALVHNGDLDRIVHLARLVGAASDSMSDEMVGRLAEIATGGLDLLDRVERADLTKALPAISALVHNGDLDRIVQIARTLGAMGDSMSDEMVTRLATLAADAMCLLDRAVRTGVMDRVLRVVEQMDAQHILTDFLSCLAGATEEAAKEPAPKGGLFGLLDIMKKPETQETIQFLMLVGKHFRSCRLKH